MSWGGPKSILEPTGVDFVWFRLDFFKIWHCFWRCFLTFSHKVSNFHCLADHCFDCPDVRPWSKQCLKFEQLGLSYFLGGKVYRGLKLCPTSPFIMKLRSQVGLGGSAKRKQFVLCASHQNEHSTKLVRTFRTKIAEGGDLVEVAFFIVASMRQIEFMTIWDFGRLTTLQESKMVSADSIYQAVGNSTPCPKNY